MKSLIILGTVLLSSSAFAGDIMSICRTMSDRGYSSKAIECMQVANQNVVDDSILNICSVQASRGYYDTALKCVQAGNGAGAVDSASLALCETINSRGYYETANSCISEFSHQAGFAANSDALNICQTEISRGYYDTGLSCLRAIRGARFDSKIVSLCNTSAQRGYYESANKCLTTLQNRTVLRGFDMCETMASRGYYDNAADCAKATSQALPQVVVIEVKPVPANIGEKCYVRQTKESVDVESFFGLTSKWASEHGRCVVAKLANTASSARIYSSEGSRVEKHRGGFSNRQVDAALSLNGMSGCETFVCEPLSAGIVF